VRGLWYFFGIVVAAGIFTGIAGLGLGYVAGLLWEQVHRHRRRERLTRKTIAEPEMDASPLPSAHAPQSSSSAGHPLRLRLVSSDLPDLPDLTGRRLTAVRFVAGCMELEFGEVRVAVGGNPTVTCGSRRSRYPDPGSRDALCALLGSRVEHIRSPTAGPIEVAFDSGCELAIERSSVAVA
jgi:hypothetical protein